MPRRASRLRRPSRVALVLGLVAVAACAQPRPPANDAAANSAAPNVGGTTADAGSPDDAAKRAAARAGLPSVSESAMVLEVSVAGDSLVVPADSSFTVTVRLRNASQAPVDLMFTSSCSFELSIATEDGREVAHPQMLCLSVIREPTLAPGEVFEDQVPYALGEPGAVRLAPGVYRLTPVLLAATDAPTRVRPVRLEVRAAPPADGAEGR